LRGLETTWKIKRKVTRKRPEEDTGHFPWRISETIGSKLFRNTGTIGVDERKKALRVTRARVRRKSGRAFIGVKGGGHDTLKEESDARGLLSAGLALEGFGSRRLNRRRGVPLTPLAQTHKERDVCAVLFLLSQPAWIKGRRTRAPYHPKNER